MADDPTTDNAQSPLDSTDTTPTNMPTEPLEPKVESPPEVSVPQVTTTEPSTRGAQPSSDVLTQTKGSIEQSESQNSTTEPTPQISDIKPQISEPPAPSQLSDADYVATLTENQLKLASALWLKKNQSVFSQKGVAKRKETMEINLRQIVDYLSHNNGAPLPRIARHTNITAGTTSKYLRQLITAGRVRAEGWAKDRRYYLK